MLFRPLISALFDVVPVVWDAYSNAVYKLVTGVKFEDKIEVEEDDEIQTYNICKYEYIPAESFDICKVNKVITFEFTEGEKEGLKANVGYSLDGNLKIFDMLEGHAMIGGASRWGKSSFLNVFITNIMLTYTPNEVILAGCDFKKSDIYYFRKYKHFVGGVSTNKNEFKNQINSLKKEMDKRSEILDKANCRNAITYNKKYDNKMTYIIFVIDELVQLVRDKECREILHTTISVCASYGIYFILASQDFTKDTIGKCKMNCSQIVGFHTLDETDSATLIGKDHNLQDINIKGRCKIKNSEGIIETQIFYLEEEKIEELLKNNLKQ